MLVQPGEKLVAAVERIRPFHDVEGSVDDPLAAAALRGGRVEAFEFDEVFGCQVPHDVHHDVGREHFVREKQVHREIAQRVRAVEIVPHERALAREPEILAARGILQRHDRRAVGGRAFVQFDAFAAARPAARLHQRDEMFGQFGFARHRGEHVVAPQDEQFGIGGGAHGRVPRRAREQRRFAEQHAGTQRR